MKDISNYSEQEFTEICKTLPCDIIKIIYGFYHRNKTYTVQAYARSKHISVATLYRYKHRVDLEFKKHQ